MDLMNPTYGLYGFAHYWPAWVHLLVVALMVVAGSLTLKALSARSAGRSRVYGLGCGFVAGLGNLSLAVRKPVTSGIWARLSRSTRSSQCL